MHQASTHSGCSTMVAEAALTAAPPYPILPRCRRWASTYATRVVRCLESSSTAATTRGPPTTDPSSVLCWAPPPVRACYPMTLSPNPNPAPEPEPNPTPGAYVCAGLSGYGVMAANAAGELLAQHVAAEPLPTYAHAFRPERWLDRDYRRRVESGAVAQGLQI